MHKYAHATSTTYVWTKYSEPRLYANRETDLIRKTWCIFNQIKQSVDHANQDQSVDQVWWS